MMEAVALSLLDPPGSPTRSPGEIIVPGKPTPWKRAGFNRKTGEYYTQTTDKAARELVGYTWRIQAGLHFGSEPVELELEAVFERPPTHFGTGRNAHLVKASAPRFPGKNLGDLDNLEKSVKDALTGIAYNDDSQVNRCRKEKRWAAAGEQAHMRIALRAL